MRPASSGFFIANCEGHPHDAIEQLVIHEKDREEGRAGKIFAKSAEFSGIAPQSERQSNTQYK
jgi:hypothetical protein